MQITTFNAIIYFLKWMKWTIALCERQQRHQQLLNSQQLGCYRKRWHFQILHILCSIVLYFACDTYFVTVSQKPTETAANVYTWKNRSSFLLCFLFSIAREVNQRMCTYTFTWKKNHYIKLAYHISSFIISCFFAKHSLSRSLTLSYIRSFNCCIYNDCVCMFVHECACMPLSLNQSEYSHSSSIDYLLIFCQW